MVDPRRETWEQYRQRILDDTSRFIEWGLNRPDEVIQIPCKPVGDSGFPRRVSEWFWTTALSPGSDRLRKWREKLMYASMFVKGLR